jgi:N-methylhydantoinase B
VFDIIKVNSRMPDVLEGDVWAAIASVRIGARRLTDLAAKYGAATFAGARWSSFMDFGEKISAKAELANLPKGVFELSEPQDDGRIFNVKIRSPTNEFIVDLRDNPTRIRGPTSTPAATA